VERHDAIVVGAGPAGSTTAYRLARAGASVLLLDRARFPRDKPCGGGVTVRAARQLPFSVEPVVEQEVDRVELGLRYRRRFDRQGGGPIVLMTQRRRLDAYLVEQAQAAGVEFRDGVRVTSAGADGAVACDGTTLRADVVIGADGANGVVGRTLGIRNRRDVGVALEGNVTYDHVDRARWRGRALIELGVVPGGYAWVFPKGEHVNVGVGGWSSEAPRLREHLSRLCKAFDIAEEHVTERRGHHLPMRGASEVAATGRALLVGDAAGLIDPLSGDGMYEAFVSGKFAAEAALALLSGRASSLDPYCAALAGRLGPAERVSWNAKLAFDRFPALVFWLVRVPLSWRLFEKVMQGERSGSDTRGIRGAPLRLLSTLGQRAA
jgi:geranylgeranyl reductase family protein